MLKTCSSLAGTEIVGCLGEGLQFRRGRRWTLRLSQLTQVSGTYSGIVGCACVTRTFPAKKLAAQPLQGEFHRPKLHSCRVRRGRVRARVQQRARISCKRERNDSAPCGFNGPSLFVMRKIPLPEYPDIITPHPAYHK